MPFIHQLRQLAFAGDDIGQVEPCKLVLPRRRRIDQATKHAAIRQGRCVGQPRHQPVIERTLVFEFQRTDAVGDVLQSIFNRVCKGIHRIDTPFVAGVVVGRSPDAVNRGIAQIDIGRSHIDFSSQYHSAIRMLGVRHLPKTL